MTPLQKLDAVLDFFAKTPFEKGGMSYDFIYKKVIPPIEDGHELNKILDKLLKDDYIDQVPGGNYIVTFEGKFWSQKNGYQGELTRQGAESKRLDAVEAYQRGQARTLNRLTG